MVMNTLFVGLLRPMGNSTQSPATLFELVDRRYEILSSLDTMVYEKRDLMDELDVSRSTIDRALHELETEQLVTDRTPGYQITLYGRTLLACYESVLSTIAHVQQAKPLLALIPPNADFNFGLLLDAEIYLATASVPQTPTTRIAELVDKASSFKGLVYAHASSKALEFFQSQILNEGMFTEVVFRDEVYTTMKDMYPDILASLDESDNFTGYVVTELSYGLFLLSMDGRTVVCLIVHDSDQQIRGIIINDTPRAVAWGTEIYEWYRQQAVSCGKKA